VGKSDLKIEVEKVKKDWNWGGSVDELLEYWFRDDANKVDQRFEAVIGDLKKKGIVCGLGTNNEKHRTNDLIHNKGLGKWFAKHLHFSSANVGHKKPEPEYFAKVTRLLGFAPEEIAFWDDDVKNVESARLHGWQANHYTDFDKLVDWSNKL
jgi:putative hydrolase of the HAD superfamily